LILAALLLSLAAPAAVWADPASDLSAAEAEEAVAEADVLAAEGEVQKSEDALRPVERRADDADRAAADAQAEVISIREELIADREDAASEIEAAEGSFDDEQSSRDTQTTIGLGIAGLAIVIALVAFVFSRVQKWPFSRRHTQLGAAGLGVLLLIGLGVAFIPSSPEAPEFSAETEELAADAEGDPFDPPSDELVAAEAAAEPLAEKAEPLDVKREAAEGVVADAESELGTAEGNLDSAQGDVRFAANVVEREERKAAREAAFREEAITIDYDQLIKNPFRYVGEKVVYTGQIFQIQEGFGSFMLLSVTDEGYGFWSDEIWVSGFGEIESAEEDMVTVYGTVTGAEEYETQIGGSRYVPKVKAKYIDE
jgi:hypothetical protein